MEHTEALAGGNAGPGEVPDPDGAGGDTLPIGRHLAISAFWFANNLHWGALLHIILPSQSERLAPVVDITKAEISGWTIALGAVVGALVPPIIGALSDRCTLGMGRRRPYVILGTLVNLLGLALFYLAFRAQSLPGYIAAWMVLGLGNNISVGAFSGIIPDVVPARQRGLASACMAVMQQVGTIGGFIIGGMLMAKGRERDMLAIALIVLLVAAVTAVTVIGTPESRLAHAEPFRWSELKHCFWLDPRQHPDFAWVWITRAFFTMGWNLVGPFLLYFIGDVVGSGNPAGSYSILGGIVLLGAIPTGLAGGILSDRLGRKRIIFIAAMVMTVACLMFAGLGALPVEARILGLFAIAIPWGFGYGAYTSVDWALGTDVLPNPEDAGKDMGVWHLSMVIPQSIATPIGALILKPFVVPGTEAYRLEGYAILFTTACVFMFLCGALIFRVKKAR